MRVPFRKGFAKPIVQGGQIETTVAAGNLRSSAHGTEPVVVAQRLRTFDRGVRRGQIVDRRVEASDVRLTLLGVEMGGRIRTEKNRAVALQLLNKILAKIRPSRQFDEFEQNAEGRHMSRFVVLLDKVVHALQTFFEAHARTNFFVARKFVNDAIGEGHCTIPKLEKDSPVITGESILVNGEIRRREPEPSSDTARAGL